MLTKSEMEDLRDLNFIAENVIGDLLEVINESTIKMGNNFPGPNLIDRKDVCLLVGT